MIRELESISGRWSNKEGKRKKQGIDPCFFALARSEGFEPPADVVPETTALSN